MSNPNGFIEKKGSCLNCEEYSLAYDGRLYHHICLIAYKLIEEEQKRDITIKPKWCPKECY